MSRHAFVAAHPCDRPWEVEERILASNLALPLNIDGNPCIEHVARLSPLRRAARAAAKELEIVVDSGGPRRPA
jgi:hypothetical protein